jgi:hypothetical protein
MHAKRPLLIAILFAVFPIVAAAIQKVNSWYELFELSIWHVLGYTASAAYIVSGGIFAATCPQLVKRFGSAEEYVKSEFEVWQRTHVDKRPDMLLGKMDPEDPRQAELFEMLQRRKSVVGLDRVKCEQEIAAIATPERWAQYVQDYLLKRYAHEAQVRPCARWWFSALWGTSVALLVAVAVHNAYIVYATFWRYK